MKLTEWYSGEQKPVRVGVYERLMKPMGDLCMYAYWDGRRWFRTEWSVHGPLTTSQSKPSCVSMYQYEPWRGLAK